MTLLTNGMGAVKKILAKTAAGRKDQVLDVIKKSRKKRLKLKDKKVKGKHWEERAEKISEMAKKDK